MKWINGLKEFNKNKGYKIGLYREKELKHIIQLWK